MKIVSPRRPKISFLYTVESFTAGIPDDCVYQCIVFDGNVFLKYNSVCAGYMQKIIHQEVMIYHHFTEKQTEICQAVNCAFDALWKKPEGYELTVIGQFYHFFGLVFSNHYYLEGVRKARRDYKRILQLKQVLEFIEHNYASPLTLKQLSASVSMSPKYFCRFFYGDDASNANGISEPSADRAGLLPAIHHRRFYHGDRLPERFQRPELFYPYL